MWEEVLAPGLDYDFLLFSFFFPVLYKFVILTVRFVNWFVSGKGLAQEYGSRVSAVDGASIIKV